MNTNKENEFGAGHENEVRIVPRLNEILTERKMTQQQLSTMTGIPQGTISRFDKNERHVDWHLFAIASALNCSVSDLFIMVKQ